MAKQGFKRNSKTVKEALNSIEAAQPFAEKIAKAAGPEARVERYVTDRIVYGVVVPADSQAKHGSATRAAQQVSGE